MTSIISFHVKHDANITVAKDNKIKLILEAERFFQQRYFRFSEEPEIFKKQLKEILPIVYELSEQDKFDYCIFNWVEEKQKEVIKDCLHPTSCLETTHHRAHAAGTYFLSPFKGCLIFSIDGGGDDGWLNIYQGRENKVKLLNRIDINLGSPYRLMGNFIKEIKSKKTFSYGRCLDLAGKLMGLSAYGSYDEELFKAIKKTMLNFKHPSDLKKFAKEVGIPFSINSLGQEPGRDLAYNTQKALENIIEEIFVKNKDLLPTKNICLTGGCVLNVLSNSNLVNKFPDYNFYVASNQNDCGISMGSICDLFPEIIVEESAWSGIPILDLKELDYFKKNFPYKKVNLRDLANYLNQGKIIGFMQGNSEHGPRALGNRSILASPSFPDIKNIINKKVKFREHYRPFAPVVIEEEANIYFDLVSKSPYMSFAALCREEYADKLGGVRHVDNSARIQTLNKSDNPLLYPLLKEFKKVSGISVLLNTSLNIKGKPIVARLKEAFNILESTELDYLYFDGDLYSAPCR